MSGLDYGNSYKRQPQKKEGVYYVENTGRWIVRVKKNVSKKAPQLCVVSTISSFDTEEEADECYNENK